MKSIVTVRGMQESQLYMSPFETQLNCPAGDVFRNAFTKKEDETEDEQQSIILL